MRVITSVFGLVALVGMIATVSAERSADAAMSVELSTVPDRPVAGEPARIRIKTFVPFNDPTTETGFRFEPYVFDEYPFAVETVRPDGTVSVTVEPFTRSEDDPLYWIAEHTFSEVSTWTLREIHFQDAYHLNPGAQVTVAVRDGSSTGSDQSFLGLAIGGAILAVLGGVAAILSHRRKRPHDSKGKPSFFR